jgi:hypothetical protein
MAAALALTAVQAVTNMALPIFKSDDVSLTLLQTAWAKLINPLLANATNSSSVLRSVTLVAGDNVINHKLGQKLQGWSIVRLRGASTIYDKQDSNSMPNLTLILNSSSAVVVDIQVF